MNLSLEGKTYVVMGVANKRSIAWAIARSLNEAGAKLVFTYADDRAKKKHYRTSTFIKRSKSKSTYLSL